MYVDIYYDVHAYEGEKLRDDYLERGDCIHGSEIITLLNAKRSEVFRYEYSEETIMKDVAAAIRRDLGLTGEMLSLMPVHIAFLNNDERYFIDDGGSNFQNLLWKYLLHKDSRSITVSLLLCCDAGSVDSDDKLRYYVHSRERSRHNCPHVHVNDAGHNYSASVSIDTGEVLEGDLPSKLARMAKERILSRQEYFYRCWNTMTDGLQVDINQKFGSIHY